MRVKKSATNSFMKLAGPGAKVARESVDEVTALGLEEVSMRPLRGNRAFADIQKARSMRFKAKQDKEALDAKNKPKRIRRGKTILWLSAASNLRLTIPTGP